MEKIDTVNNEVNNEVKIVNRKRNEDLRILAERVLERQMPLDVVAFIYGADKESGLKEEVRDRMLNVYQRIKESLPERFYGDLSVKIRKRIALLYGINEDVLSGNTGVYRVKGSVSEDRVSDYGIALSRTFTRGERMYKPREKAKKMTETDRLVQLSGSGTIFLDIENVKAEEGLTENDDSLKISEVLSSPSTNLDRLKLYVEKVFCGLVTTLSSQNSVISICQNLQSINFTCKGRKNGYTVFQLDFDLVNSLNTASLSQRDLKGNNGLDDTPEPPYVTSVKTEQGVPNKTDGVLTAEDMLYQSEVHTKTEDELKESGERSKLPSGTSLYKKFKTRNSI